jgi:hypothetical protein
MPSGPRVSFLLRKLVDVGFLECAAIWPNTSSLQSQFICYF